jgi:hypothetical protein
MGVGKRDGDDQVRGCLEVKFSGRDLESNFGADPAEDHPKLS